MPEVLESSAVPVSKGESVGGEENVARRLRMGVGEPLAMVDGLAVAPRLKDVSTVPEKDAANEALDVAVLLSSAPPEALLQGEFVAKTEGVRGGEGLPDRVGETEAIGEGVLPAPRAP